MILVLAYCLGGCVAKSSHVDELTKNNYEIVKELSVIFPDNENFKVIERDAYVLAKESSAVVDDAAIERIIGFIGSLLSKLLGFDISTYLTIGLGIMGIGGTAKVVVDKRKKKKDDKEKKELDIVEKLNLSKKMTALANMNPDEADKIKDII